MEVLGDLWGTFLELIKRHPFEAFLVGLAFARLLGTTVETGWRGVLFQFGRARRVLEPGFHFLLPWIHQVRKVRNRSVTLDLDPQVVTTADGLVYRVDANLVYRVDDPIRALVEIDDWRRGCETALALSVQECFLSRNRSSLDPTEALERDLESRVAPRLQRWGIAVERVGLTTIEPSPRTFRVTQLGRKVEERRQVQELYRSAGLSPGIGLALLGGERRLVARTGWRSREARRRVEPELLAPTAPRRDREAVPDGAEPRRSGFAATPSP